MVWTALLRTLFFYVLILLALRLMGKREIGALQPIDFVVTIMIADLAVIPIENTDLPLLMGVVPILLLLVLEIGLAWLCMRSKAARSLICGNPSIVVQDGRLVEKEMKRLGYNIDDLLEQLREKNLPNVQDVEMAILETNGRLSVIPRSQKRWVRPSDLQIESQYEGLPHTLISDGKVDYASLKKCGLDLTWLLAQLRERGINDPKEVFYASLDTTGRFFVQEKGNTNWIVRQPQ